jgi:hypothetical protein
MNAEIRFSIIALVPLMPAPLTHAEKIARALRGESGLN